MLKLSLLKRVILPVVLVAALAATWSPAAAQSQAQPQTPAQTEFVPIDELPPQDQMPAAPLVIAAYAVAWVGMFIYLASIWRRLQRVDRDLADVSRRIAERSRT